MVRRNFAREPCLSDFSSFAHKETTLVKDPIFSEDAVLEYVQTPEEEHDEKRNMEVLPQKGEKW